MTGNETPFEVGVSKALTCTAVGIDVARIEWKFLYAGFDLELRSATGVNELTITPTPSQVGTQMFWCVVVSTTGAIYSRDAPITIKG